MRNQSLLFILALSTGSATAAPVARAFGEPVVPTLSGPTARSFAEPAAADEAELLARVLAEPLAPLLAEPFARSFAEPTPLSAARAEPEAALPGSFLLTPPQARERDAGNYGSLRVSFEIGGREYNSTWGNLNRHSTFGFTFAQEPPGYIIGWDAGIFWSNDSGSAGSLNLKVNTWELYGGLAKILHIIPHRLRAEIAAGMAMNYVYAHDRDAVVNDINEDFFVSGYGRLGLNLRVGGTAWAGIGARAVRGGSASVFGRDLDGDYEQLTFSLSNSW